ncbi:cyclopropane-fatty-acyl-phospholipid synthase [Halomonas litopenaei]|uniref:Cyclopropane-fatty-acyl-phospholipid synthase n=1 Tax=Halomonas litopenaei TaxID=2109328 RepID=A0ABX5IWV9_9GAMM|nr:MULTISPECIES: cyclopropane fatty acyl phospholipid synthase [Halomonas]PTL90742.1 cyclopropane-fatty-acyl-phospholipid synthase [Halomonas sp. SYSU XM8]PTL93336.1 cyclopropane-fatty-acyl-phospholipid synthase [Halomonas litopenaei]
MTSDARPHPIALPNNRPRLIIEQLLEGSGIRLNGPEPHDIQIYHPDLFARILHQGTLGLGEAYMDGWWEARRIDQLAHRLLRHGLGQRSRSAASHLFYRLQAGFFNLQSRARAYQVGEVHYDLGNDLFRYMLDDTMCYSCGYWRQATTLHQAQLAKLDLVCRKLALRPGMHLLDIGCGWGSLAEHAARHYGVSVTGITISREQVALARERCQGLPVDIQLADYRDLQGQYDRIASIGMFEHVGQRNYTTFFRTVADLLPDDGLFLLHTIGSNTSRITADPWIHRYIFPNGVLPSARQICQHSEETLMVEDWQNFGPDYDPTLLAWLANLDACWHDIARHYNTRHCNERTYRMLRYYLAICAGAFRARYLQLWQVVFSRGRELRYDAPR